MEHQVPARWLRRIQTLRRDDRVGDARPRAHAMPGSVVTVQLGQCGNQVRVSASLGVVLLAPDVVLRAASDHHVGTPR